jgi:head-tail adaptor
MGFIAGATRIAARRHLVQVFGPSTRVPDGEGGYTETLGPLDPPTWNVSIEPVATTADQLAAGATIQTTGQYRVVGDYRPDLRTTSRLDFNGRQFYVNGIANATEANAELELLCREVTAETSTRGVR